MASPSEQSVGVYETTNLTLATFLIMNGVKPTIAQKGSTGRGHPIGAWMFGDTERVRDLVEEFEDGRARVEPQAFHGSLTRTRSKLLDALGISKG